MANEPNARGLAEITADLASSLDSRSWHGMVKASTELAAYSGDLLAALVACTPVVAAQLRVTGVGHPAHPQAARAARLILDLTGIDPEKG